MEKYMFVIIPILMTIAISVYRLNENSSNSSNVTNQSSNTGKYKAQFAGQMKRCGYCSTRVPLDSKTCLQCPDKMPLFSWETEPYVPKSIATKPDEPKSLEFKIKEIDRLRESGVITEEEYQSKRKTIIESH